MEHTLEVDVHAHWSTNPPVYRLYIDDEMFTERTFGWTPYQFYLTETMFSSLDTGVHTLQLIALDKNGQFDLQNFNIDKKPVQAHLKRHITEEIIEWRFIVDNVLEKKDQTFYDSWFVTQPEKTKKYETNIALVQKMRMLNEQATKK